MNLEDYNKIKDLIDDIVGVETIQGNNLKKAIKNYFETKPKKFKLVNENGVSKSYSSANISRFKEDADKAMQKYTAKLKKETKELKERGEYCGASG